MTTDEVHRPTGGTAPGVRLNSIDLLRGAVMVIMALDHVRDYFSNAPFDPLDLTETTVPMFLTRWVTHLCAPVFVFLAGTGAFLSGTRGRSRSQVSRFLLSRGLWLVILEMTVIRIAWQYNVNLRIFHGGVIWVIGWSMVALGGLVYLPRTVIAVVGVAIVSLHNLLDPFPPEAFGSFDWLWKVIHVPEPIILGERSLFNPLYTLMPWIGVMASGYAFGGIMLFEPERRRRILVQLGLGLTVLFVVLRFSNIYGDPVAWADQGDALFTFLSFINTEKYPASLLFLLMTLGPSIAALAFFERDFGRIGRMLAVVGRVPLFYYVLHLYLIHGLAVIAGVIQGFPLRRLLVGHWVFPKRYGFDLPVVYGVWAFVVAVLYPVCAWFAEVKRRSRSVWMSYL